MKILYIKTKKYAIIYHCLIILRFCLIDKIALDFLFSKKLKHIKTYLAKKTKKCNKTQSFFIEKSIKSEIVVQSYNMQMNDNSTVNDVDGM